MDQSHVRGCSKLRVVSFDETLICEGVISQFEAECHRSYNRHYHQQSPDDVNRGNRRGRDRDDDENNDDGRDGDMPAEEDAIRNSSKFP